MRKDGRRVKTAQPMYQVAAHIMDQRCDSMNMMEIDVPIEPMQAYLNKKRAEGKEYSHLGLVLAAYVRTVAEYPIINRFVVNKTIYARNEITFGRSLRSTTCIKRSTGMCRRIAERAIRTRPMISSASC